EVGDLRVRLDERGIVPSSDDADLESGRTGLTLEARERGGDGALDRLELVRNGDPVAVVPHRHEERDLQHAGRGHRLPEQALARTGVADGRERDLLSVPREARRRRA